MKYILHNINTIENIINEIRHRSKGIVFTNYFKQELNTESLPVVTIDDAIVFLDKEIDFYRLFYFTYNLNNLNTCLNELHITPITIDYITNNFSNELDTVFKECGFENIALYKRIQNNKIPSYNTNDKLSFAEEKECEYLYNRILTDFSKYTDHILTKKTLLQLITDKQVIVTRIENQISGYIIYQLQGKKLNFNYWYNEGKPLNSLILLINMYGLMNQKGIKSSFGWVNVKKKDVIKTHQKFGFKFDGLEDYIYKR